MMKWSRWPAAKKFQVKIKEIKVEGLHHDGGGGDDGGREKVMVVEIRWKGGPKPGFVPFHRPRRKNVSTETIVEKGEPIKWDDEFENTCSFPASYKDHAGSPRVSFTLLYGTKMGNKLVAIGKASLNLAEMATKTEAGLIETKLPISFNVTGVAGEATLSVCLSFAEVRDSQDSAGTVRSATESKNEEPAKENELLDGVSSDDSDASAVFDSERTMSENELVPMTRRVDANSVTESRAGPSSETQLDSVKKAGFFSWKRRRLSFIRGKTKVEPLIKKTRYDDFDVVDSMLDGQEESSSTCHWEEKELISRDGQAKIKASVSFASFDQCSDKAAGESACTVLVAVIAHWLQLNRANTPTRSEFDRLIIEGSSEWRKLCDNEHLIGRFPDKHFDLDTVLQAGLRAVSVSPEKSLIGFFSPEKFESLKGVMSFDQIWDEIRNTDATWDGPRVYIVSWNDHFFVLKVDEKAYYLIDTLGERLYEGCDQAYILRFDDSALMRVKVDRERVETLGEQANEEEICRGKECCREYIKRFLAAIPLRELESEEEKEPMSYFALHQRLQIEFNLSYSFPSLSSSSSTNSTSSLFSNGSMYL